MRKGEFCVYLIIYLGVLNNILLAVKSFEFYNTNFSVIGFFGVELNTKMNSAFM